MEREQYSSGAKWEPLAGYSRAVKAGHYIFVSGTTATDEEGNLIGKGDLYTQTIQSLKNIDTAVNALGGNLKSITRTRMFVTDIDQWETTAKAHGEFFRDIRPATSMLEVSRLIDPDMLIEIEADAILHE